jgi:uncharacterized protein
MNSPAHRAAIENYIQANANPPDKLSHQPRLYALARQLAGECVFDDDVLHAAAWLHDIGVFVGHRPEEPAALAAWDNVAYAAAQTPKLLRQFGFPAEKIASVVNVIRTHLPSGHPDSFEGELLRDADMVEQLGATGILRTVSKIGRDTRFRTFDDALRVLKRHAEQLPAKLRLTTARRMAEPRVRTLLMFIEAAESEACASAL